MALPATEDFTGSNGVQVSALANWSKNTSFDCDIYNNRACPDKPNQEQCDYWNADSFNNNQYAKGVITRASGAAPLVGPAVRAASGAESYYGLYFFYYDTGPVYEVYIFKVVSGSWTEIDSDASYAIPDGATARLEVDGTTLTPLVNDATPGALEASYTDSDLSSGYAGICGYGDATTMQIDNWEGGNLEAGVTLVVADGAHAHAADNIVLTQAHVLAVAEALHAHLADSPILTQAHVLAVAEALHAHSSDPIALLQAHQIAVDDALHGHAADAPILTQVHILTIAEALHGHAVDPIVLSQIHQLAVNESLHGHLADNITLDTGAIILVVADALHGHSADSIALIQAHTLAVAAALHGHSSDPVTLSQVHQLIVAGAAHGHSADGITLTQTHQLLVNAGLHAVASDPIALTQVHSLIVSAGAHGHLADNISLLYGDLFPIIFDVIPRERIHDVLARGRIQDVEPRERIFDRKRSDD